VFDGLTLRLFTGLRDLHFVTAVVCEENQQVLNRKHSKWLSPEYFQYTLCAISTTCWLKSAENVCIIALGLGWLPTLILNILCSTHPTSHSFQLLTVAHGLKSMFFCMNKGCGVENIHYTTHFST
jgi:hypothetical protein